MEGIAGIEFLPALQTMVCYRGTIYHPHEGSCQQPMNLRYNDTASQICVESFSHVRKY
jgi:hypothetical protein